MMEEGEMVFERLLRWCCEVLLYERKKIFFIFVSRERVCNVVVESERVCNVVVESERVNNHCRE